MISDAKKYFLDKVSTLFFSCRKNFFPATKIIFLPEENYSCEMQMRAEHLHELGQ